MTICPMCEYCTRGIFDSKATSRLKSSLFIFSIRSSFSLARDGPATRVVMLVARFEAIQTVCFVVVAVVASHLPACCVPEPAARWVSSGDNRCTQMRALYIPSLRCTHVVRFRAGGMTGATSVHHPRAVPHSHTKFATMSAMIRAEYPLPAAAVSARVGVASSSSASPSTDEDVVALREQHHFEEMRQAQTRAFFENCEPTDVGVTNYDDAANGALNECLRAAAWPSPDATFCRGIERVVEVGSGTGRLVPFLTAGLGLDGARRFTFCEPDAHLRAACDRATATWNRDAARNKDGAVVAESTDWSAAEVAARTWRGSDFDDHYQRRHALLVMSGVAQYVPDALLQALLAGFDRVLLQEDVCDSFVAAAAARNARAAVAPGGREDMCAVLHNRDGSWVRSEAYFAELFRVQGMEIAGTARHEVDSCVTRTWSLTRSSPTPL